MTSKEALEKLNNLIWREKHINSERNKTINECINTIQQDLERLETIESLRTTPNALEKTLAKYMNKCIELEKECDNLQRNYDEKDFECIDLYKENKKLKEAVTMLYLVAKLYDFEVYNNLDEKDKNLLNEVLGNA